MKKFVAGSKNCQPMKKLSGFQLSRDLFSSTTRICKADPSACACASRKSARITDTTRPDSGFELGRFCGQRHRFHRRANPGRICSVQADGLPTRAPVLVLPETD